MGIGLLSLVVIEDDDRFGLPFFMQLSEAWQKWKQYTCVEWNGDHLWLVDLDGPDEDNTIYIRCDYCKTVPYDIYGDFEIHGIINVDGIEVEIDYGKHWPSITAESIPVHVELVVEECGWEYKEYDVWLTLSDRD